MELKFKQINQIDSGDFDKFIRSFYKKPYCIQQQNGCMSRGAIEFSIPLINDDSILFNVELFDYLDDLPSLQEWLLKDPSEKVEGITFLDIYWERDFYPKLSEILNDLYEKQKIVEGDYQIVI